MKIHQLGLLLMISSFSYAKNVDFKLEAVPLPKAISIIYDEVLQKPYMLDPKLSNDSRVISFHTTEQQNFEQFIQRYFSNMNISVSEKKVLFILDILNQNSRK